MKDKSKKGKVHPGIALLSGKFPLIGNALKYHPVWGRSARLGLEPQGLVLPLAIVILLILKGCGLI